MSTLTNLSFLKMHEVSGSHTNIPNIAIIHHKDSFKSNLKKK